MKKSSILVLVVVLILGIIALWRFQKVSIKRPGIKIEAVKEKEEITESKSQAEPEPVEKPVSEPEVRIAPKPEPKLEPKPKVEPIPKPKSEPPEEVLEFNWPLSPDGRYKATRVGSGNDWHYQVKEVSTGQVILKTNAQYTSSNDVKAGAFSSDSQQFAVAYHYGHKGDYTWIAIWSLETGEQIDDWEDHTGFIYDLSGVFEH
ncbi:hypothetical protein KKB18_02025 [bacterium]|nr:hypothetical protein [bacterium]